MKYTFTPPAPVEKSSLLGRTKLVVTRPAQLNAESIGKILDEIVPIHSANSEAIDYLLAYYRGWQPIIQRKKEVRSDIKNIVIENRAWEIIQSKLGFEFSNPVQYTNAGSIDSKPIDILNTYARLDGKEKKDISLAEWMYVCGIGYRICLPQKVPNIDRAPYFTDVLDPRYTFVVYSNDVGDEPLLACSYVARDVITGNGQSKKEYVYGVYTDREYYTFVLDNEHDGFARVNPVRMANPIGSIPIVPYMLNEQMLGYVELCITLFNAINTVGSNRVDDIEQLVQSLLILINCDLPIDEKGNPKIPKSGDAISVKSVQGMPADVKYLVSKLDQSTAQTVKDDLLKAVYEICGVPDRKTQNTGGDTGQAVLLRDGFAASESRARSTEKFFRKAEMDYLRIVLRICRDIATSEIGDMTLRDIDVKLSRNKSDGLQVKAQSLKMLLDSGVNPEDAYSVVELFSDPTAIWIKSRQWQDENAVFVENKFKISREVGGAGTSELQADASEQLPAEE